MNRKILAATVGVVVILVAVWYTALWKPAAKRLTAAKAAVSTGQAQLRSLEFRAVSLSSESRKLPSEVRKLDALQTSVPVSVDVPQVLVQLAGAIRSSGVVVTGESQNVVAPASTGTATAAPTGLQTVALTLTAQGSYGQLMAFLQDLGRLPRAALVQTVGISPGSGASGLSASIDLDVFYDPTPLPKVPTVR